MDKTQVATTLAAVLDGQLTEDEIVNLIEAPKDLSKGDAAFPVFMLAKKLKQSPVQIATELVEKMDVTAYQKVEAVGPYINFFFQKAHVSQATLAQVLKEGADFGQNQDGQGGQVPIDMSSPNIAKPMSVGHLRSTMIGNSLAEILTKNGYRPIKINHLGDWGTQFGLMIQAYKMWGDKDISEYSIAELVQLYVRVNEAAREDETVAQQGRDWFKKLEDGDPEATQLWQTIRDASLVEFNEIYERLHVQFDSMNGEAFYEDKMSSVVDMLHDKKLLVESQGAEIVDLPELTGDENLPIAMIKRTDGATLYITRDLAAAMYRYETYHFVKSLYVVGSEQQGHFKQLKAILKLAGYDWADDIEHINFGLITVEGKKMSTRKGNVFPLIDLLNEAHDLAAQQISAKNPDLANADEVAEMVGSGAVVFHDLMNDRTGSIDFKLSDVVRFEGDTGPYVQYTHARAQSLLRKAGQEIDVNALALDDEKSWEIISILNSFSDTVKRAWRDREPSVIAKYALRLARAFNSYYADTKVLVEDEQFNARLGLVKATTIVLAESLRLLGIQAPNEM